MMIIANIVGCLALFYLLWKKLKEDYHYERIFNLCFSLLIGVIISFFASKYFLKDYWFWIYVLGVSLSFTFGIIRQKIKFFESFEGLVIGILPWLGLYFFVEAIRMSSLFNFVAFWIVLLLVFIFFFLDSQYRKYTWYKSGKVGFSGVVTTILFFLIRSILGIFFPNIASLAPNFESILSGTFAFSFFLLLYNLARVKE